MSRKDDSSLREMTGRMQLKSSQISSIDIFDRKNQAKAEELPIGLKVVLLIIIFGGLALRLVYPTITAFCKDQARACAIAEDIVNGHWQTGGLINSGGFRNLPGFVYIMAAVWWFWPNPLALIYFTGVVNILAVLLSAYLMQRWIGKAGAWWATALLAAAPWPIQYSRWIWAQDMLFPAALLVYLFLWLWICRESRWAVLWVILSLVLLVQIHLAGVLLALAVGLLVIWCRPKVSIRPVIVGTMLAVASVLPYLLDGQFRLPSAIRFGYEHFWRIVPSSMMSVTGLGWQLEFRSGYTAFAQSLVWRRWPYEIVMVLPLIVFAVGTVLGLRRLWQKRRDWPVVRREPLSMVMSLIILIPLSFVLIGLRTSPTYLPLWYPLPFALMGWTVAQIMRRQNWCCCHKWIAPVLLVVLCVQLTFFVEQLHYIRVNGGVPSSDLGRSYAGMKSDIAKIVKAVDSAEIWMLYEGPSRIHDGRFLAVGSEPFSTIYVWDIKTGSKPDTIGTGMTILNALAFSPDSSLLAASGRIADQKIKIWKISNTP